MKRIDSFWFILLIAALVLGIDCASKLPTIIPIDDIIGRYQLVRHCKKNLPWLKEETAEYKKELIGGKIEVYENNEFYFEKRVRDIDKTKTPPDNQEYAAFSIPGWYEYKNDGKIIFYYKTTHPDCPELVATFGGLVAGDLIMIQDDEFQKIEGDSL